MRFALPQECPALVRGPGKQHSPGRHLLSGTGSHRRLHYPPLRIRQCGRRDTAVSLVIFLTAIPISYYAARYGVDIDLLTRGAGFGYIGSTITSLIYASFTLSFSPSRPPSWPWRWKCCSGVPLVLGYLICSRGDHSLCNPRDHHDQPVPGLDPASLHFSPTGAFCFIVYADASSVSDWTQFEGLNPVDSGGFSIVMFGAAAAVVFSLIAQIGEQVDFLRFIPEPRNARKSDVGGPPLWQADLAGL